MNDIKKKLIEKVDHLKNGLALIYQHEEDDVKRSYLVISAENLQDETVIALLANGRNLSILVSDYFIKKNTKYRNVKSSDIPLSCTLSLEGLKELMSSLVDNEALAGHDRILMRAVKSTEILDDTSAEARILELMSNVDEADGVLIYGLLMDDEKGQPKEVVEQIAGVDTKVITTDEILVSRFFNPNLIEFTGVTDLELQQGDFKLYSYYSEIDRRYHWAFVADDGSDKVPLVRIESECLTGHVFGSLLCDCGDQLSKGLEEVQKYGKGALVYLRQEGRGIGLEAKLDAYYLQQVHGMDTVDANIAVGMPEDARDYVIGAQILNHLSFDFIKLMTNNPAKIDGLHRYGLKIDAQVSHIIPPSKHNKRYLDTKKTRMGHRI
ncbi:MAG: GTP cyclohydrolase II [Lentisphaerales bacterium]|nr:GTP cyclohydrolase II [Lentisphaerales bacterium]